MPDTNHIHNLGYQIATRRILRSNLTPAEALLWKALQRSQLDGRKFRRQHSIGPYIVDFYCPAEKLVVEMAQGISRRVARRRMRSEILI